MECFIESPVTGRWANVPPVLRASACPYRRFEQSTLARNARTSVENGQMIVECPDTGALYKDLVMPMLALERARMRRGECG